MPSCCAVNCRNRPEKLSTKSFHAFPRAKPHLYQQWLANIKRDNWEPSPSSRLCSDHFTESCFDRWGVRVRLKSDAVPTLFSLPELTQKGVTDKIPVVRDPTPVTKPSGVPHPSTRHGVKSAPGSVNTVPVAPGKSASSVKTNCSGKNGRKYFKLLKCVDHESGVHSVGCPDYIHVAPPPAKQARIRAKPAVPLGTTSPKKKTQSSSKNKKKKKAGRSKHTQTVCSSGHGSISLLLSTTNGTDASTQVNHRIQVEKGCSTERTVDRTPNRSRAQLTSTPPSIPVRAGGSDSTDNLSCENRPRDPQIAASPSSSPPHLASFPSDSRVMKQEPTEHEESGWEIVTGPQEASHQEPLSAQLTEVEEMGLWDSIKQEVVELENGNSGEGRAVPCEVLAEEHVLPDVPDPVVLLNGTRVKEEVVDSEENSKSKEHPVTGESEAASLLGVSWIKQEVTEGDDWVEHCIDSRGPSQPEKPRIKQEPMEFDDSSSWAGSVAPHEGLQQESLSPQLTADPGYFLAGCDINGIPGTTQERSGRHSGALDEGTTGVLFTAVKEEPTSPNP